MEDRLRRAFEACRRIHEKYGKSYYFATRFFPEEKRLATYALYAFFRIPDEIVDEGSGTDEELREKLLLWQQAWQEAYAKGYSDDPVLHASAYVFHTYNIPFHYSEAFLEAMLMDTQKKTYETYAELEAYMYGSAAVVGLMMTHVIGFSDTSALAYATNLGYAMQLTNFLRDIREDWEERERIYLPQEDLRRFGLTSADIEQNRYSPAFVECMRFQIARADALYDASVPGISLLQQDGRFAVRAAGALYREILRKIEDRHYNVFLGRVRTSAAEKLWIALRCAFLR